VEEFKTSRVKLVKILTVCC